MANHMKEVANMLGVELGKEFDVNVDDNIIKAKITIDNIQILNKPCFWGGWDSASLLMGLVCGYYNICNKPWKPAFYEQYYSIGPGGALEPGTWMNDFIDRMLYKLGNCYPTPQEAESNKRKWITFYSSDNILEV